MSNSTNSLPADELVSHNVYFDGKVQSLGLDTLAGKATIGVMKKGSYTFAASSAEKMIIISGSMEVKLNHTDFKEYHAKDEFDVAAGTSFDVKCDGDVAYLCYYG